MKLGSNTHDQQVEVYSTGSLSLDIALGIGGVPKGRIIEIYGPESSGKTTMTFMLLQKLKRKKEFVLLLMLSMP